MPCAVRYIHLLAILVTPWLYGGAPDTVRYGLTTVALISAAAWLWQQRTIAASVAWPATACVGWGLLQTVAVSRAPVPTFESTLLLAAGLGTVVFWSHEARHETAARRLAYAILLVCAAQGAFGVIQAAATPHSLYGRVDAHIASPYGSFENHNHFAGLLGMGVLLALALALGRAKLADGIDPWTIGWAGLSLALAGAHLASRSRGGMLALIAGGATLVVAWQLAISKRATTRRDWAITAVVLAVLLLFGWMAVPASTRGHLATAFYGPTDSSGSYRIAIAGAVLRLWWAHPVFGCGLGTFVDEVTRFKRADGLIRAGHAESDALELLAEGGLVALALFAWLTAGVVRGFLDRVREGRDPWRKGLAVGAMSAVVALLAHSFLDFNLRIPSNALVFSVLVGLAGAPRTEPATKLPLFAGRLLAAAFLLLGTAAAWRAIGAAELRSAQESAVAPEKLAGLSRVLVRHPYLAEAWRERSHVRWGLARGGREMTTHRLRGAADDMQQVLRLRPHMSYAWADLGWLQHMRGDAKAAEEAFGRAAEQDPADVAIGLARTEFFARTGRLEAARQELRRIRRYNLDWPDAAAETAARQWSLGTLK